MDDKLSRKFAISRFHWIQRRADSDPGKSTNPNNAQLNLTRQQIFLCTPKPVFQRLCTEVRIFSCSTRDRTFYKLTKHRRVKVFVTARRSRSGGDLQEGWRLRDQRRSQLRRCWRGCNKAQTRHLRGLQQAMRRCLSRLLPVYMIPHKFRECTYIMIDFNQHKISCCF